MKKATPVIIILVLLLTFIYHNHLPEHKIELTDGGISWHEDTGKATHIAFKLLNKSNLHLKRVEIKITIFEGSTPDKDKVIDDFVLDLAPDIPSGGAKSVKEEVYDIENLPERWTWSHEITKAKAKTDWVFF